MRRRGFTLIEIMLVIMILGMLATIIIPRVAHRAYDGKRAKAVADVAILKSLIEQYRTDTKHYPTTDEGLSSLVSVPTNAKGWQGPYIQALPSDPWGRSYVYTGPSTNTTPSQDSFEIVSYGSDGASGGTGEAADISDDASQP